MADQTSLSIKMILDAWKTQIANANKFFDSASNEVLFAEVAPGKNTGVYLLGHLAAVHDALFNVLNLGDMLFPEMEEVFVKQPDKSGLSRPSAAELRGRWNTVNNKLQEHFDKLTADEWFKKHSLISDADFETQPHRNRLNVIINRTNHLSYHLGQIMLLKN